MDRAGRCAGDVAIGRADARFDRRAAGLTAVRPMRSLDFNCDLGEGCGQGRGHRSAHQLGQHVSWRAHAGDEATMRAAIASCLAHGVAIGAHPYVRGSRTLRPARTRAGARRNPRAGGAAGGLARPACAEAGTRLHHVKPHGALYNLAARDAGVAAAIADAVRDPDAGLGLYGLANSN